MEMQMRTYNGVAPLQLAVFFFNIVINPGSAVVFEPAKHSEYSQKTHDGVYKLEKMENGKVYYNQASAAIPFDDALVVVLEFLDSKEESNAVEIARMVIESDLIKLALKMSVERVGDAPVVAFRSEMGYWESGHFHKIPLDKHDPNVVMRVIERVRKTDLEKEFEKAGFTKGHTDVIKMVETFGTKDGKTAFRHEDHKMH